MATAVAAIPLIDPLPRPRPGHRPGAVARTRRPGRRGRPGTAAEPDHAELMRRVALGDQHAFAVLHDRFAPRVFGVVRAVLRDPSQSEEVTQEVFVEAWRTAARFDRDRGRLDSWLLTMAHRRAIDRVRSEQAARNRHDVVGRRSVDVPHDDVVESVLTSFEHAQLREAMAVLTEAQREAIVLAWFRGMTYREVAEYLETPLGTIKTRMRDGMARLRDALEDAVA